MLYEPDREISEDLLFLQANLDVPSYVLTLQGLVYDNPPLAFFVQVTAQLSVQSVNVRV